jgi:hypothetical protein
VVGIILSETGTDGAHGIRVIKSNDGITIVQDARSAKFGGMPNAAIEAGSVDLVLPRLNTFSYTVLYLIYPIFFEPLVSYPIIVRVASHMFWCFGTDRTSSSTTDWIREAAIV